MGEAEQTRRRPALLLRATPALVPSDVRPAAGVLAVGAALVVVTLGLVVHGSSSPGATDRAVTAALRTRWPSPGTFTLAVDGLVDPVPLVVTVALLAVLAWAAGHRRLAVLAVLAPLGVAVATTVLKPVVGRTIHGDNLSFPSGHTGYATAVGLVLGLLLVRLVGRGRPVWAALVIALAPALLTGGGMAVDQLVLDAHYPSDALGGGCTAIAVVLGLALVLDRLLGAGSPRPRDLR